MAASSSAFSSFNLNFLRNLSVLLTFFLLLANFLSHQVAAASLISIKEGEENTVTVNLKGQGDVLGNYDTTTWSKQRFMQFRGVPYAESPKGPLRFKAPVARQSWSSYVDATKWGRRCPDIKTILSLNATETAEDLEDCLSLCVYTKNLTSKAPVMMYIHGGGFYNGSSLDHPPNYLMEKDIVLVVPQYRIGALGFISTTTDEIPGNAAIADMLFALQWIQDHIHTFGGDPERVTIFGQSAGAAIVGALILSPRTPKIYFQRAIMQSGSITSHWATSVEQPEKQAKRICENLKCQNCENLHGTNECLMNVNVKNLLMATTQEYICPVIGDKLGLLPAHPSALFEKFNKTITVMAGFTKHDGSFVLAEYYNKIQRNKNVKSFNSISVRNFISEAIDLMKDRTRLTNNLNTRLFFKREILDSTNHTKALPSYFDLFSVLYFKSPALAITSKLMQSKNAGEIFLYTFDYEGEHTRFGYELGNEHYPFNGGVHHSNENIYLFATHQLNEKDAKISQKIVDLWTSFASNGRPNAADNVTIDAMVSESGPYFHIDVENKVSFDAFDEFTSTMDDPFNYKLIRPNISFL